MFLDSSKPIATCSSTSCQDCPLLESLHCHFRRKDLASFLAAVLPGFFIGGLGIYYINPWLLVPWIVVALSYFGLFEIRVMCAHCPHYAEPGTSLKCWANYGSPKLWRYRPGPMSVAEKIVFLVGLIFIFGYPLLLLLWNTSWLPATAYGVATGTSYLFMRKTMCSQCMNFACPLNTVDEETKKAFFARNPRVEKAWELETS